MLYALAVSYLTFEVTGRSIYIEVLLTYCVVGFLFFIWRKRHPAAWIDGSVLFIPHSFSKPYSIDIKNVESFYLKSVKNDSQVVRRYYLIMSKDNMSYSPVIVNTSMSSVWLNLLKIQLKMCHLITYKKKVLHI